MPETWTTYRRALGGALGWHLFSAQSSTGSAAAANTVVLLDLQDSNLEANFTDTVWEFQPTGTNAGEVRRAVKGGLAPGTGTLTLSRAHTAATTAAATVELYGVLPPTQHLGRRGLLQAANLALKECWMIDTLSITGVSTAYQYPLSTAYPWLDTEDKVIDMWVRRTGENRDVLVPWWEWLDTNSFQFQSPFSTADTLKPRVYRPLDTWIGVSGTFANSTVPGLVNETDQGLLSVGGMLQVGLYWCYEFLATEGAPDQRSEWRRMADRQRIKANTWKRAHLPHDTGRDAHARRMAPSLQADWPFGALST